MGFVYPKMAKRLKPIIVVLGATATGKSKLAMEMASEFNGEIISADSMQVGPVSHLRLSNVNESRVVVIYNVHISCFI